MVEELRHRIGNLANNSPTLLLGEAASIFKKNYTKEVIKLNTEEDCVNYIKRDLKLVAGGGYNSDHIHNVTFEIERM